MRPADLLPIDTARLRLRAFSPTDGPACHRLHSQSQVVRFLTLDVQSREEVDAYIAEAVESAGRSPAECFDLAMELRDGAFIGRCGLKIERPDHLEAQIWYVLDPAHWGRGLATEAVAALLELAFSRLTLHRVFADCDPRNLGSARVCERLGMRREAHLRENWRLKGEWCDSWIYAILADEWRVQHAAAVRSPD